MSAHHWLLLLTSWGVGVSVQQPPSHCGALTLRVNRTQGDIIAKGLTAGQKKAVGSRKIANSSKGLVAEPYKPPLHIKMKGWILIPTTSPPTMWGIGCRNSIYASEYSLNGSNWPYLLHLTLQRAA